MIKDATEIALIMNYISPFSLASSFAQIQTTANKYKPVCQLVKTKNMGFLCKSSLQKIQFAQIAKKIFRFCKICKKKRSKNLHNAKMQRIFTE